MSKRIFPTLGALCESLGSYVSEVAAEAVAKHGEFRVAVSGGSLPSQLKQALIESPKVRDSIDWSRWKVRSTNHLHALARLKQSPLLFFSIILSLFFSICVTSV